MKAGRGWCFHRGGGDDRRLVLRSSVLPSVVLRRTPGAARGSYVFDVEYRGRTGMRCGLDVSAKSRATAVVWFDDRVREHSAVASAALQTLADFCFTDLTLQRIEVGALAGDATLPELLTELGMHAESTAQPFPDPLGRLGDFSRWALARSQWVRARPA